MNDTKWDELRLAMYALDPPPSFRTCAMNGHCSLPDREWFYHFREGGYAWIRYVDIGTDDTVQREMVRAALKKVHVPGEERPEGFRVFGYVEDGQFVTYI
jgi:hypothetical protein